MRYLKSVLLLLVLVGGVSNISAQGRNNQFELYGGAALPLSPDEFKDSFKVGLSLNLQYVFFPSPRLGIPFFVGVEGFTVDNDGISDQFGQQFIVGQPIVDNVGNVIGQATGGTLDAEGTAGALKFGLGLRPYLTPLASPIQLFLFGSGTFNIVRDEEQINGGTVQWQDFSGNQRSFDLSDQDIINLFGQREFEEDFEKFGISAGGGIEIPAGATVNLIFQGLFNIIFTDEESTTFVGVTAGLVF